MNAFVGTQPDFANSNATLPRSSMVGAADSRYSSLRSVMDSTLHRSSSNMGTDNEYVSVRSTFAESDQYVFGDIEE